MADLAAQPLQPVGGRQCPICGAGDNAVMPEPEPDDVMRTPFTCSRSLEGDEVVIWLRGELDLATRATFVEAFTAVLSDATALFAQVSLVSPLSPPQATHGNVEGPSSSVR
jgi:hypothetical protein